MRGKRRRTRRDTLSTLIMKTERMERILQRKAQIQQNILAEKRKPDLWEAREDSEIGTRVMQTNPSSRVIIV